MGLWFTSSFCFQLLHIKLLWQQEKKLKDIMLSAISQSQKKCWMILYVRHLNSQVEVENRIMVTKGMGWGVMGTCCSMHIKLKKKR